MYTLRDPESRSVPRAAATISALTASAVVLLTACGDVGLLDPAVVTAREPAGIVGSATVVVNPDVSTYDLPGEFTAAVTPAQETGFEEFTGSLVYTQTTPWTTHGVTYTSALNIILGPGVGLGVQSNSLGTEFGMPVTGTFDAADAITAFGVELALYGNLVPVEAELRTNVGTYTLGTVSVPLATTGRQFFGITLSRPGEYLTGFRFTSGTGAALLLDDVIIGHLGASNARPVAAAGGPYAGAEGSAIAFAFGGSDADDDPLEYSWDLGDGTAGSGPVPPTSHRYADDGSYAVLLAVSDGRGGVDTARTVAVVANVAPTLAAISLPVAPVALGPAGATVSVAAAVTDPGTVDTFVGSLDCGTGSTIDALVADGSLTGTCVFTTPGVYQVQATVLDDDGGMDAHAAATQLVIYDASGAWVTGGGWIPSPAGAYAQAPASTGKLTFGFVARYGTAATEPNGQAEFRLNVGKLDFRSTSLEWLVAADSRVQLQGRGTLGGAGDYRFSVLARDSAGGDAIRIRIRDAATGALVYDNCPSEPADADAMTPLGGGSIQLHDR